jgi:hypothetical protein
MSGEPWSTLDRHLRLRLADLPARQFEDFFLHFLNSGVSLTIVRHGRKLTRKVISATTYSGEGKEQKGIDLSVKVEGPEEWCFQCKRHKTWNRAQTLEAINAAKRYQAHHFFLVVACDPGADVHDEMRNHPNWMLWNLDTVCAEFRLSVPPTSQAKCLFFLDPAEIRRFVPFASEALVPPEEFFSRFLGPEKLFRHDWKLVGHEDELRALDEFVQGDHPKVLLLVSKGGDGKSRLLWEFTRDLHTRLPGTQALFLNPHSRDEPVFSLLTDATRRVVVVDDAHRVEQVPLELLSVVWKDPAAKLVMATRPQGVKALAPKLFEVGLQESPCILRLKKLKKPDVSALAAEALGATLAGNARALADLTADCPFLTVLAGELLRQGRISWGQWANDSEFRQHAFRAFEAENLRNVAEEDRLLAQRLLRIVAMLAPLPAGADFIEKAARCLKSPVIAVETQFQRLWAAELVVGREDGSRIVPDLFADFLVYDTCYEPTSRMPTFAKQVITEFPECRPAALRNLAEAAWVAQANGVADDTLVRALVESEMQRFEAATFYDRAVILRYWRTFGVYLPKECLALGRLAISLDTAPRWTRPLSEGEIWDRLDAHEAVLRELPALLQPIAQYHDDHRTEALNLLWKLGLRAGWPAFGGDQNPPWSTIAEIFKLQPNKPISITLSALRWFAELLDKPDVLKVLEGHAPILRTLLQPCFARFVEFHEWEGRTVRWWTRPVHLENTQEVRDQALAIVRQVIDRGSWLAVLDALSALEVAVARIAPVDAKRVEDPDRFRLQWRPERQKAIALYEHALARHAHIAVRFEIRQTLRRDLAYEEDTVFAADCRRVLATIPEDLTLRVATALLSHGFFEFDEKIQDWPKDQKRIGDFWDQKRHETAVELGQAHPTPEALFAFLHELGEQMNRAGNHPLFGPFLAELAKAHPVLAAGLARHILEVGLETPLAREVPLLAYENAALTDSERVSVLAKTARSSIPGAAASAVDFLAWRLRQDSYAPSTEEAGLLFELAAKPDADVGGKLLSLCASAGESALPLVCRILEALPVAELPPRIAEGVWDVLVPYRKRATPLPKNLVAHFLQQLVAVPELDPHQHWEQFHSLTQTMPRALYTLVRNRVLHAATPQAPRNYVPLLAGYRFTLRLPGLVGEPDYAAICDDLWQRVLNRQEPHRHHWRELWQAVVLNDAGNWLPRLEREVQAAQSAEDLSELVRLLRFDGSVLIFRLPDLARAFLTRAQALGGDDLVSSVRADLWVGCGPMGRGYTDGVLDKEYDYVEAEAAKAAEVHASDPVLGPFYRWIARREQEDRLWNKARSAAQMAALD